MKRLTEYKTFSLITKILVTGFIVIILIGCNGSIEMREENTDTLLTPSLDTTTIVLDTTPVESIPVTIDTFVVDTIKEIKKTENDSLSLEREKWHKLKMQKEKIYRLEEKINSYKIKWDSIESAAKEYRK